MNIRAEFERQKNGHWVATIPGVQEVSGYGSTRHEAAVELTVSALYVLADQVKSGQLKVEDEPAEILLPSAAEDRLAAILVWLLRGLEAEAAQTPNAETIAAIEELESGGGESCDSIEELMARLNAD
jgi:hypothetical protein